MDYSEICATHIGYRTFKGISFFCVALSASVQITQVFSFRSNFGNATEATIVMAIWALRYLGIAMIYFIAFCYLGTNILLDQSLYDMGATLTRIIFGFVDPDVIDPFIDQNYEGHFFIGMYLIIIFIIVLNGLISIMMMSLEEDMSEANSRQRLNFTRYRFLKFEAECDFWPIPFNIFAWVFGVFRICDFSEGGHSC